MSHSAQNTLESHILDVDKRPCYFVEFSFVSMNTRQESVAEVTNTEWTIEHLIKCCTQSQVPVLYVTIATQQLQKQPAARNGHQTV